MSKQTRKPLSLMTDKELEEGLMTQAQRVESFSYNDVNSEIERRRQDRHANRIYRLSILALVASLVSLSLSVLVALYK